MPVTAIESLAQFHEVINSDSYTIVDFWAVWCGPCRTISPIFEKFSEVYTSVKFYKVDVDEREDIGTECAIRAMPSFLMFKAGTQVGSVIGARPRELEELLVKTAGAAPVAVVDAPVESAAPVAPTA